MLIKGIEFKSGNKPVICVPVMENDIDEIIEKAKNAIGTKCPMIEWRMDCFSDYLELDKVRQILDKLAGLCNNTVLLATLRTVGQGGNAEIGSDKLGEYYTRLAGMHAADLIDVEFFELDKPGQVIKNIHEMGGKVITSHHDFAETPEMSTMAMIYEEMLNVSQEYKSLANKLNLDYLDLILHVGEDFELLFTISKEDSEKLPINFKVIGEVTDSDVVELTLENGFVETIKNKGYEHYVSE